MYKNVYRNCATPPLPCFTNIYIYVYIHTHTHAHTYIYIYIYIYINIYIYIYIIYTGLARRHLFHAAEPQGLGQGA